MPHNRLYVLVHVRLQDEPVAALEACRYAANLLIACMRQDPMPLARFIWSGILPGASMLAMAGSL